MNMLFTAVAVMSSADVSVPESFLLSLVGFSLVFAVLLVLILVIRTIAGVSQKMEKPAAEGASPVVPAVTLSNSSTPETEKIPAPGSLGDIDLYSVDDKTAALLMAVVADELKTPLNELRFKSIKELEETK